MAARAAIENALGMLTKAVAAGKRDSRPAIQDALGEMRQLLIQATKGFNAGDYRCALTKAQSASKIPPTLLCMIG